MADDFDVTLPYGEEGEQIVREYGRLMAQGEVGCEVKRKSRPDLTFYVETEQHTEHGAGPWKPSGVHATEAPLFAFVQVETGVVVIAPTALWRQAVETPIGSKAEQPARHQGNPTRGMLIELRRFLDRYEPDSSGWPVPDGGWKELSEL